MKIVKTENHRSWAALAAAFLVLFMVSANASQNDLEERANSRWKGETRQAVVEQFGPPDRISKDTLGNRSFQYSTHGRTETAKFAFSFNPSGKVIFVRVKLFVEDNGQIEQAREDEERDLLRARIQAESIRQMGAAFGQAARGPNPY